MINVFVKSIEFKETANKCKQRLVYTSIFIMLLFSRPVVSNFLLLHTLQHAFPSPTPRVCPSSCSLHQRCHPAVSSYDAPINDDNKSVIYLYFHKGSKHGIYNTKIAYFLPNRIFLKKL